MAALDVGLMVLQRGRAAKVFDKKETINRARALKEMCSKLRLYNCMGCPFFFEKMNGCVLADDNLPRDWELDEVCEDD